MADKNIKKSIIKNKDLPPFSGQTGKIRLRYRVISEDRNRASHWSKIQEVAMPTIASPYSYTLSIQKQGNTSIHEVILQWARPEITTQDMRDYDIFLKTNTAVGEPAVSTYSYNQTQEGFFSVRFLLDQNDVDNFNVIVQKATYDRIINTSQILVKTTKENL
jgi:hypothetical protein